MLIRLLQQETTFWKKNYQRDQKKLRQAAAMAINSMQFSVSLVAQQNALFFNTQTPSHSIRFNVSAKTLRNLPNQEFGYDVFNKDSTSMHQLKLVFINLSLKSTPEEKEWLVKINAFGYTNPLKLQKSFLIRQI